MAFTRLINDLAIIAALDNLPNATSGLTAAQLKAKFDEASGLIKTYLNSTLAAELEATTDGDSGLDNVGMTAIGAYTNPQLFLEYLYSTLGALSPAPQSLERQAIINSNMEVAQRGTSFNIATATSAYTIDRFKSVNLGSGVSASVSQSSITDLDGSTNGLRMIHAGTPTAQGKLSHVYTMEAKDSYKLAGRQVTFSVKALGVGLMRFVTINARYKTSNSAISNSDTLIGTINGSARSDMWLTTTLTVTLPTRATLTENGVIGIEIIASKLTPESNGDGFIISQLSLNTGAAALPFQPRSFAEELALCQRYYAKTFPYNVPPANGGGVTNFVGCLMGKSETSIDDPETNWQYPVVMRIAPTITLYNPRISGSSGQWTNNFVDSANARSYNTGDARTVIDNTDVFLTTAAWMIHATADAEL